MASNAAPAAVGDIIAGRYRIDAWLGQGNMAVVFRATHLGTSQTCALKLVHSHLVERPEVREMFLKEAHVGARIGRNPHIVDVFDAGFDEARGVPYLAMELLEGEALDRYIKNHGAASPALVRTIFHQVADALEQAHAQGVIHRDLKPANLFLTFDRKRQAHVKIVDFGIAKLTEQDVQRTATQIGTPAYAAPEQLGAHMRNIAAKQGVHIASTVGPATDIWPLGIIAFELLIGGFPGQLWTTSRSIELVELLMRIVLEPTPNAIERAGEKAASLPRGFDAWLERCLRKNAAERWSRAQEAVNQLSRLLDEGYDDEATRQMDAARANDLVHSLISPKPSEPTKELAPKNAGTLPLASVPDVPNASIAAGPRGTAVMEVKRDATGRPTALSRPDAPAEVDEGLTRQASTLAKASLFETHFEVDDSVPEPRAIRIVKSKPVKSQPQPASEVARSKPAPLPQAAVAPKPAVTAVSHAPAVVFPPARSTQGRHRVPKIVWGVLALGVVLAVVAAFLFPRKGSLSVIVVNTKSLAMPPFEVFIDGRMRCTMTPCVVNDLPVGSRSIRVGVEGGRATVPVDVVVEWRNEKTFMIDLNDAR